MLNSKVITDIRNSIHYIQPMLDNERRHSLWYNSDVATFTYKGNTYTLRANGPIRAYLTVRHENENQTIAVQNEETSFYDQINPFVSSDDTLMKLIQGETVNDISLDVVESNWWEIFVTNGKPEHQQSVCCESDDYDEAITEMIDAVKWLYPDPQLDEHLYVHVYHETNDGATFGELLTVIFACQNDARQYLRKRVEAYFGKRWIQCKSIVMQDAMNGNSFSTDYVSYGPTSDGYYFWSIEKHSIH